MTRELKLIWDSIDSAIWPEGPEGPAIIEHWRREVRTDDDLPSYTCPRCGMTSYHPDDVKEGYCGHCHNWTRPDVVISCPCGCGRVYTDPGIEAEVMRFVGELGECVKLSTPAGSWLVPRHYIALHGIKADELPALAETHGWEQE